MKNNENVVMAPPPASTFRVRARDVTGLNEFEMTGVARGTPVSEVARTMAAQMDLPTDVPWSLRSDRTGAWLRDEVALDSQVEEEEEVTLVPRAHLGGASRQ